MDSETLEGIQILFNNIDIEDEPGSEKNSIYSGGLFEYHYKPKPVLRYTPKSYINFERYIKENCHNKVQILNRETFYGTLRPIIIFFNHFREKCAYHTKWLDLLYQLAAKYGDSIDFIAADMIDMDVMYPGRNPMRFFCRLVRPEHESPHIFAIDEKKRIYEHFDAYKTKENLLQVCDNLLNGNLFLSEPIPQPNDMSLVKKCVHHSYEEVVLKSSKNIFLIITLEHCHFYDEPNYEMAALALKDYSLDVVYMWAEKNYVPFEYYANCYPTILFIPFNDKNNFIYYEGQRHEHLIIEFLKSVLQQPDVLQRKQRELKSRVSQKFVEVKSDFQMELQDLPQFLRQHFDSRFKLLDRKILEKFKRISVIIFMDFSQNIFLAQHIKWLNKLYQFVESSYAYEFFVADFKDIDIINTKWKPAEVRNSAQENPRIYVIDHIKHSYEFGNFETPAALYYFTQTIESRQCYYSQLYQRQNINEKVKVWTADYFNIFLKKSKKHIFITFYSSEDKNVEQMLNVLEQIAVDVADHNVEIAKFDIRWNYVDLEYAHDSYPVSYFIPKTNKRLSRLYVEQHLNKEKLLEFIISNLYKKQ